MLELINRVIKHYFNAVMLWGYGWKSRECSLDDEYYVQWRDPFTGVWYRQPTALKLLQVQVLDEFDRR